MVVPYVVKLDDNTRFEFSAYKSDQSFPGSVFVAWEVGNEYQERLVHYTDLREFARAAMDATTDALVAGAIAEGKVPT